MVRAQASTCPSLASAPTLRMASWGTCPLAPSPWLACAREWAPRTPAKPPVGNGTGCAAVQPEREGQPLLRIKRRMYKEGGAPSRPHRMSLTAQPQDGGGAESQDVGGGLAAHKKRVDRPRTGQGAGGPSCRFEKAGGGARLHDQHGRLARVPALLLLAVACNNRGRTAEKDSPPPASADYRARSERVKVQEHRPAAASLAGDCAGQQRLQAGRHHHATLLIKSQQASWAATQLDGAMPA